MKRLWNGFRERFLPGGRRWKTYPWYGKTVTISLAYMVVLFLVAPVLVLLLPESWQDAEWGWYIFATLMVLETLAFIFLWLFGIAFWAWYKGRNPLRWGLVSHSWLFLFPIGLFLVVVVPGLNPLLRWWLVGLEALLLFLSPLLAFLFLLFCKNKRWPRVPRDRPPLKP